MLPQIKFCVHNILVSAVFFAGSKEKFYQDIEFFYNHWKPIEESVLSFIETFSGFSWTKEYVPIYIIPENPVIPWSYTKFDLEEDKPGVVLKIRENQHRNIHILIHELVHVLQHQTQWYSKEYKLIDKEGKKNTDLIEVTADIVTLYTLIKLLGKDSEYEKDFWDFLQNTSEKNKRKYEELTKVRDVWDLEVNNLKHYL